MLILETDVGYAAGEPDRYFLLPGFYEYAYY
jgi:hypothetical protein